MLSKVALLAVLAALAQGNPVRNSIQARQKGCNGDNLLNRFRGAQYSSQAQEFCATFAGPVVTATITAAAESIPTDQAASRSYPSPLFNTRFPMTYQEERVSSACHCVPHSTITRTHTNWVAEVTPAATTTSSSSTSETDSVSSPSVTESVSYSSSSSSTSADSDAASTSTSFTDSASITDSATVTDSASTTSSTSTSVTSADSTSSISTSSAPAGPTATHNCWKEPEGKRALQGPSTVDAGMTVAMCADFCRDYTYYGVEYASECYCGNEVIAGAFPVGSSAECSTPCSGKPDEVCGGNLRLNLYTASGPAYSVPGRPMASEVTGAFTRKGCFREPGGGRILSQGWDSNSMTKDVCLYSCAVNGFTYAGIEWGRECWCDNQMNNATPLADEFCQLPLATRCSGNPGAPCGGDVTIEIFSTTG
ncbi:hypothetical protein RB597_005462 [Gaeumannomyces tritici]